MRTESELTIIRERGVAPKPLVLETVLRAGYCGSTTRLGQQVRGRTTVSLAAHT